MNTSRHKVHKPDENGDCINCGMLAIEMHGQLCSGGRLSKAEETKSKLLKRIKRNK